LFRKDPMAGWLGSGSVLKNAAGEYVMNFSEDYDCGSPSCQSIFFATSPVGPQELDAGSVRSRAPFTVSICQVRRRQEPTLWGADLLRGQHKDTPQACQLRGVRVEALRRCSRPFRRPRSLLSTRAPRLTAPCCQHHQPSRMCSSTTMAASQAKLQGTR
jgi:hypothetical protein